MSVKEWNQKSKIHWMRKFKMKIIQSLTQNEKCQKWNRFKNENENLRVSVEWQISEW